jgi:hypothetical protein
LPLDFNSIGTKVDKEYVYNMLYHICKLDFIGVNDIKKLVKEYANKADVIGRYMLDKVEVENE